MGNEYAKVLKQKKDQEKKRLIRSTSAFLLDIAKSVLHSEFGFGQERLDRFVDGMSNRLIEYDKAAGSDPYFYFYSDEKLRQELRQFDKSAAEVSEELGPCPECGWLVGMVEVEYRVKCQKCGKATEWHPLKDQALEAWEFGE